MRHMRSRWPAYAGLAFAVTLACGPVIENGASAAGDGPANAAPAGPRVFFTDIETGPVSGGVNNAGVPISIFGKGFGAVQGSSRVTIGGVEAASYLVWGSNNANNRTLDMIVVQPGPKVEGGSIVVTVNGRQSNSGNSFAPNSGHVYFVATDGSDKNACSQAAPCATILHVVSNVMKAGDTVLVRGGDYDEGEIWIRAAQGGARGQPKVVKNYPGEKVNLNNAARGFLLDADYVTVSGLAFRNGKSLDVTGWASPDQRGARFVNNMFAGNIGYAAIGLHGHDHVLAGNVCEVDSSSVGTMGHCYYVSHGSNLKILYNVAAGAPGYGLHIYDERRSSTDFQRIISNVLVEGNILKASRQRSGMIVSMSDHGGYGNVIQNVTICNNIFFGNNHAGLVIMGKSQGISVHNNTFYQNGSLGLYVDGTNINGVDIRNNLLFQSPNDACKVDCTVFRQAHLQVGEGAQNVNVSNNSYHPGSPNLIGRNDPNAVTGQVRFVDAGALDFHVLSGSAVIDRGVALETVPADYDGRRRPQGSAYDMGAFEYQPRSPVLSAVVHSATFLQAPVAPGAMVTGFGYDLGPDEPVLPQAPDGLLEQELYETRVLFDGAPAPVLFLQANHVNALVPYRVSDRSSVRVEVEVSGQRSNAIVLPVERTAPGLFTLNCSGRGQGVILNEDGTLNEASNPARKGSTIALYASGLGATNPAKSDGLVMMDAGAVIPLAPVSVRIGGLESEVVRVGAAPGYVIGLFQIRARIPEGAASGETVPVVLLAGAAATQAGVTLRIQ